MKLVPEQNSSPGRAAALPRFEIADAEHGADLPYLQKQPRQLLSSAAGRNAWKTDSRGMEKAPWDQPLCRTGCRCWLPGDGLEKESRGKVLCQNYFGVGTYVSEKS